MPLQWLGLWGCPRIKELGPLRGMPLKSLYLSGTSVKDLRPVLGSPIENLELEGTPFTEFHFLTNFALRNLNLGHTRLKDLSVLASLTGLGYLRLNDSPVSDLRPLSLLPLRDLRLNGTQVSDLEPLSAMRLDRLEIEATKVTDLRPLEGKDIRRLSLARTRVTDLSPIQGLPLEQLFLDGCDALTDLGPLTNLHKLRTLTIPAQTKDIEFLRHLPNLREVGHSWELLLPPAEFARLHEERSTRSGTRAGSASLAR